MGMNHQVSEAAPGHAVSRTFRLAFYLSMIGLALVYVVLVFRGLNSASGMEHAQLARELARGNGWVTKCVRPAKWRQALDSQQAVDVTALVDSQSAPIYPLLLAPVFRLAEASWEYEPARDGVVYGLDRVVAAVGVGCFLLLLYHLHGLGSRLFDANLAAVAVAAVGLSQTLWELAVSGSPRMLLALELVLALRLVYALSERLREHEPVMGRSLALGVMLALLMLTHWIGVVWAVVLTVGLLVLVPGAGKRALPLLLLPVFAALGWWAWRNWQDTGEMLGGARLTLRAVLMGTGEDEVARSFTEMTGAAFLPGVLRDMALRLVAQWHGLFGHLGLLVGAPVALLAVFHRFRRPSCSVLLWILVALLGVSMVAMAFMAPVKDLRDEHNVFPVLAAPLSLFGVAMLAMLWARLYPGGRSFWQTWGYGLAVVLIGSFPLLTTLPNAVKSGLVMRGLLSQWPPYAADRVALVGDLIEPGEVVMADAPWFTAWYADVTSIWLPVRRTDFAMLKAEVEKSGKRVAGVVITPVSSETDLLGKIFAGPWSEWPDLIFRGPLLAFDREMRAWPDFPFNIAIPLVGFSTGESEGLGLLMAFYTDRQRALKPKPAKPTAGDATEGGEN
jgi:hypothetical protein